jgi:hypothetical protein
VRSHWQVLWMLQSFGALRLDSDEWVMDEAKVVTMFQLKVRILMFLGLAVIWVAPPIVCQESGAHEERIIKVPSASGESALVLQISTEQNRGVVSVRDERGAEVQRLSCPLLRDNTAVSEDELAAVREQFLRQFVVRDLDSDEHPDLAGVREFGANWARYCVWLYDPKQHFFAKDFLAEQMELMTNLEPLAGGQISTSHMGPENMWRAVYRITEVEGSRPARQLVPVYSCLVETKPGGEKPASVVTVRYESGNAIVQRHEAGKMDIKAALDACNSSKR